MDKSKYEYLTLFLFPPKAPHNRYSFPIPHMEAELQFDGLAEAAQVIPNFMADPENGGFRTIAMTLLGETVAFLFEKEKSVILLPR